MIRIARVTWTDMAAYLTGHRNNKRHAPGEGDPERDIPASARSFFSSEATDTVGRPRDEQANTTILLWTWLHSVSKGAGAETRSPRYPTTRSQPEVICRPGVDPTLLQMHTTLRTACTASRRHRLLRSITTMELQVPADPFCYISRRVIGCLGWRDALPRCACQPNQQQLVNGPVKAAY